MSDSTPRYCNQVLGCPKQVVLAKPVGQQKWRAYLVDPVPAFTPACDVLVGGQAWDPVDLAEHYAGRFGLASDKARELVGGFPFHARHYHLQHTNPKEN